MTRGVRLNRNRRRAFATLLVFGVILIASVVTGVLQSTAFGQAAAGREALARVRATWAARAGVEATIARLEFDTDSEAGGDAYRVLDDMAAEAVGTLAGASWRIATWEGKTELPGPSDAHARLNVNALTRDQLLAIEPLMTEDVADAVLDWVDADDDTRELGAEIGYYASLPYPYEPRNAPMRTLQELELVAGVRAEDVRGEDWNLNGVLDPGENDGDSSWPRDNADDVLDRGWSGVLTAESLEGTLAPSGEEKLDLTVAAEEDLVDRLGVTRDQAKVVIDHVGTSAEAALADFITRDLATLALAAGGGGQGSAGVEALTSEQLGLLLDECRIGPASEGAFEPGRLNINTCAAETLEYLPEIDAEVADAIIAEREARPEGFASTAELMEVSGIGRRQLAAIARLLTVRSTVYVVTSRGRDARTGLEVEIVATLDRSSLPVVISAMVVR